MRPGEERLVERLRQVRRHHDEDRYFGGGFGRIPSVRRTMRLTKPRGFLSPDISVSRLQCAHTGSAAHAAPMMKRLRRCRARPRCQATPTAVSAATGYARRVEEAVATAGRERRRRGAPSRRVAQFRVHLDCRAHRPRRRRRSLRRSAVRACAAFSDLTLRMPTPMNMFVKAPGSTKTYGFRSHQRPPRPSASCLSRAVPARCRRERTHRASRSPPGSRGRRCSPSPG